MIRPLLVSFAVATLSVASAATFHLSLVEPSVVKGQTLKAGDCKLDVKTDSVTIEQGKTKLDVPAKIESAQKKFDRTRILYHENNGKFTIQEIDLGGTKTKLTFDSGVQTGGGE